MVHGIRIRDGKAEWYRNRWVRGPQTAKALGEQPPPGDFRLSGIGANTNVIGHAGKTLALIESGVSNVELTDELDTVGACDFDGTLTGGYTAHPKRDPDTGELHAVSYSMYRGNTVQYSVIGADGQSAAHRRHRGDGQPDDARHVADRERTSSSTTCPSHSTAGRRSR